MNMEMLQQYWWVIAIAVVLLLVLGFVLSKKSRKDRIAQEEKEKIKELEQMARQLIEAIGGKENIKDVHLDQTKVCFDVEDGFEAKDKAIREAGAAGIVRPKKKEVQVIVGPKAEVVYDEVKRLL